MNIYHLKRIRKRYDIFKRDRYWGLVNKSKRTESAHPSFGYAFYYMMKDYLVFYRFGKWVSKGQERIMNNLDRSNEASRLQLVKQLNEE